MWEGKWRIIRRIKNNWRQIAVHRAEWAKVVKEAAHIKLNIIIMDLAGTLEFQLKYLFSLFFFIFWRRDLRWSITWVLLRPRHSTFWFVPEYPTRVRVPELISCSSISAYNSRKPSNPIPVSLPWRVFELKNFRIPPHYCKTLPVKI